MTNNFCGFLSNGLFITDKEEDNNLSFSPCCIYQEKSTDINNNNWKDIKDWTPNCDKCLLNEKNNKKSLRQEMNPWFNEVNQKGLAYLEIDYSNACNAACGICDSMSSSSIANILRKEGNNSVYTPNVSQITFLKTINDLDLTHIRIIKFRGGEPFYSKFHQKILENIKFPNNVTAVYQTNGSIYPNDVWWKLVKNLKEVHISFSIDAVGEKFNYIRSNLNFAKVEDNIIKILKNKEANVTASIECTINPLNAFYYDDIFNLYIKLKKINKNITLNWHDCWEHWGLENTPPKLRNLITQKYKNINLCKVINELEFDESKFIKFVLSLQKHEKRFNLNTEKIFPEVYPLIMEEYERIINRHH